jgi:hypothetical protein
VVAIVDSTGVMGAAAVADTYSLLGQAIAELGGAANDGLTKKLRRSINRLGVNKAIEPDPPSATCPVGHTTTTTGAGRDHQGRLVPVVNFADDRWEARPAGAGCTTSAHGRWLPLNFHQARLEAARTEQARPATKRKLPPRAVIERKLAEGKQHAMGKTPYRGPRTVLLQQRITAGMLNLKRIFTIDPGLSGTADALRAGHVFPRKHVSTIPSRQSPPNPPAASHFFGTHLGLVPVST